MSRRDNGLSAASYTRVVDVETHVVDGLLDRLREEDVAAYVAPAAGARGPYGDTVLPEAPRDSVYVDTERSDHGRHVVQSYLAEIREELEWENIVAGFGEPPVEGAVPRWPVSEDVDPSAVEEPLPTPVTSGESLRDLDPLREDHFVPPPPPPVPVPDTINRVAWAAVLGGPLFLVLGTILNLDTGGWLGLLAVAAFVGGFVTLVARMKDRSETDLDGDDGAVV